MLFTITSAIPSIFLLLTIIVPDYCCQATMDSNLAYAKIDTSAQGYKAQTYELTYGFQYVSKYMTAAGNLTSGPECLASCRHEVDKCGAVVFDWCTGQCMHVAMENAKNRKLPLPANSCRVIVFAEPVPSMAWWEWESFPTGLYPVQFVEASEEKNANEKNNKKNKKINKRRYEFKVKFAHERTPAGSAIGSDLTGGQCVRKCVTMNPETACKGVNYNWITRECFQVAPEHYPKEDEASTWFRLQFFDKTGTWKKDWQMLNVILIL